MLDRPAATTADPPVSFGIDELHTDARIAVIGCGGIAGVHLEVYRDVGYDVVGLCDIDRSQAEARQTEFFPEAPVFTDHHQLLDTVDADVIDITTPPGPRANLIQDALTAGHHVLSQKPFVLDLDTGEELVELAERADRLLAVNQNARWSPDIGYMRAAVEAGAIGDPHGFYVTRCWDYNRIAGDGISHRLVNHYMIHWLDAARYLLPGEPVNVYAVTARSPTQRPSEPILAQCVLTFEDAHATLTFDGDTHHDPNHEMRLVGPEGTVVSRGPALNDRTVSISTAEHEVPAPVETAGDWIPGGFLGTMEGLLTSIESGTEPAHSGQDNLGTAALVFAALESARTGRPIEPGTIQSIPDA